MRANASMENLTAETVQSAALAFQSIDDIHSGDGLALGVLRVGDGRPTRSRCSSLRGGSTSLA